MAYHSTPTLLDSRVDLGFEFFRTLSWKLQGPDLKIDFISSCTCLHLQLLEPAPEFVFEGCSSKKNVSTASVLKRALARSEASKAHSVQGHADAEPRAVARFLSFTVGDLTAFSLRRVQGCCCSTWTSDAVKLDCSSSWRRSKLGRPQVVVSVDDRMRSRCFRTVAKAW